MICPYCQIACHENFTVIGRAQYPQLLTRDGKVVTPGTDWYVRQMQCPECFGGIFSIRKHDNGCASEPWLVVYPKNVPRPVPPEVEDPYKTDFIEASTVLNDSPKASAAISRRCLQMILRDFAKAKPSDLSREIDEVLPKLPSQLAMSVDAVRNIGNFAAHPIKSTHTGEIFPVEPGEAEWLLDVLEGLFDFYIVQPKILQDKRDALDKKLAEAGKPAMK